MLKLSPSDFPCLLEVYGSDLPAARSFNVELDLWQNKWTNNPVLAQELSIPEKTLKHTDSDYFPNIHTLIIIILATLPVTSCECERSISMLKNVKTALRSSMSQTRFTMLQYHKDIPVTADEVIQEYIQIQPSRGKYI